jgi:hypothetical protein
VRTWATRETFYQSGMEHSPTSATGHRIGSNARARDATGGVGGVQAAGNELSVEDPSPARSNSQAA